MSLFNHLVHDGDVEANRNGAGLPAWLRCHDCVPSSGQNSLLKARIKSKRGGYRYSIAITLCDQHLLRDQLKFKFKFKLKQKSCLVPVKLMFSQASVCWSVGL